MVYDPKDGLLKFKTGQLLKETNGAQQPKAKAYVKLINKYYRYLDAFVSSVNGRSPASGGTDMWAMLSYAETKDRMNLGALRIIDDKAAALTRWADTCWGFLHTASIVMQFKPSIVDTFEFIFYTFWFCLPCDICATHFKGKPRDLLWTQLVVDPITTLFEFHNSVNMGPRLSGAEPSSMPIEKFLLKYNLTNNNNDVINNNFVNNYVVNNDVVNNEVINNEVINNKVINNEVINNDVINNEVINNDVINNDVINNDIIKNDVINDAVITKRRPRFMET